jgi:hypothetical protein
MNTFATTLYRDLTCGAAATLITLVLSLSFLQSTSVPPGVHAAPALPLVGIQPKHAWFGQPEPAVLVD